MVSRTSLLIQTSLHHTHQTNQDNVLFADFIFNRKMKSYLTHRASHIWTISNESIYDYDIKDIIIILYSNCNHCNFVQPDFLYSCNWSNFISEGIQKRWQNWPYISPWVPLWITRQTKHKCPMACWTAKLKFSAIAFLSFALSPLSIFVVYQFWRLFRTVHCW